jgi:hypothetical protein
MWTKPPSDQRFAPRGTSKDGPANFFVAWGENYYGPASSIFCGSPDLFALRVALLRRQHNLSESAFSSLQVGYKQGLDCAARLRLTDLTENEALIGFSFATRAPLVLAAERIRRGLLT